LPALFATADDVLRRAAWTVRPDRPLQSLVRLTLCLAVFALLYGAAMGLFRGVNGQSEWLLQMVYSAIKAPLLLLGSFVVSLPSFFVISTLFGLRQDFERALRALVAAQAGLAVALASLAPLTVLFYLSNGDYQQALLFNAAMFAIASGAGQYLLRIHYRPLIAANARHKTMLIVWGVVYAFVAVQLAWLVRPFIGSYAEDVTFLRPDAWDNAYVVVLRLVWRAMVGS
jgi:hypothetical protein